MRKHSIGSSLLLLLLGQATAEAQSVYRVSMKNAGVMGVLTNCSPEGYVLAHGDNRQLQANATDLDAGGEPGPPLLLNLSTDVDWSRSYDAGRGTSGVFRGCFGETSADLLTGNQGFSGSLFLFFETNKGISSVRFIWHFDYFLTADVREHFTMDSGKIPFPQFNGVSVSGRVEGVFDLKYYRREGKRLLNKYTSLTGGVGRFFDFDLEITKIR